MLCNPMQLLCNAIQCNGYLDQVLYTEEVAASDSHKQGGVAPLVLQVDAGSCLQEKGEAPQVPCMSTRYYQFR